MSRDFHTCAIAEVSIGYTRDEETDWNYR